MEKFIARVGLSSTDASRAVSRICDEMVISIIYIMESSKIQSIDFTKIDENSFYRPIINLDYMGKIVGIELDNNELMLIAEDGRKQPYGMSASYYLSYYDVYSILACVENCIVPKNRKKYAESGIVTKFA